MTRTARIERYPLVYHIASPPRYLPALWAAWSDKTGHPIVLTTRRQTCERLARRLHYEPRLWLRYGDKGRDRIKPLIRWAFWRILLWARENLTNASSKQETQL
ncbi:hypothetical protein LCGC14_1902390 [marine sediment metagenome]|uniref:Uncharacterized protein n=1 Tax=marine sediment metagenome TaxID=412755 RepID=A0A0F9IU95_9ZZZZ